MSNDTVMTVTIKGVGDFSDVVSNVGSVQKALTKLKLPDKLGDNLSKNITNFYKEYEKYQKKISEGIKTQGDYNQVEKSLNNMRNLYQAIGKDAQKLTQLDIKDMLNLDTGELKKIMDEMTSVMKQIGSVKIDTTPFDKAFKDIQNITKNSKIVGEGGLLNQIIGHINTGQITEAKKQLQELQNYAKKVAPRTTADGRQAPGTLSPEKYQQLTSAINTMNGAVAQAEAAINPYIKKHNELQRELDETKQKAAQGIIKDVSDYNRASKEVDRYTESLKKMHQEEFNFNRQATDISRQIQQYFGLTQIIRKVGDIARDAFATVKELDKAMTATAVVTNFSVGDMWEMLPTYTAQANQLGSTIKDVYEAATLYYQQGLNTNQAMALANETLKMARIAGLDAADATNMMTAALRGFNMEINQTSAQKINDVYSELAAITASDTREIGSAMERTASIANAANMEFSTTSAFLAQMIETTREAPENLGTAMKTIVARFQEMKQDPTKLIDSEGVAMDANKVDKALKTIGVQLLNTKGEFRDLDDVFLDIASKWDSLTQGQQRYIATIAAGSRQQSRFIAMMSNYERTMELVDAANNSAGASQRQFEKTLDSMEAKLNKLKNAWDQFTMGLMNNQILKFGVDRLTDAFTIINKLIDVLSKLGKPFGLEGLNKSLLTLVSTVGLLNFGGRGASAVAGGVLGWLGGEGFSKGFSAGWGRPGAAKIGTEAGQIYAQSFSSAVKKFQLKDAFELTKSRAKEIYATNNKTGEYANTFRAAFSDFSAEELSANWTPQIEAEIRSAFQRATANVDLTQYGIEDAKEYENGLISTLRSGKSSAAVEAKILNEMTDGKVDLDSTGVNEMSKSMEDLDNRFMKTGASLQTFGMALQDTPLAPFGALLSKIGMLTSGFGSTVGKAMTIFKEGMKGTAMAEVEVGAGATAMAAGETTATAATGGLIGGIQALWGALLESPLFPFIAVLAGLVVAYKALDWAIVSNKEQLEAATDAAAAASEAYDSAKQETSELADSINTIRETDSVFDGLVAGTAEFNEQLVTANEQIMALIDKYPMLNDSRYLSTDKNGLMHINEAGFKAVKEYQKQIQARASAMNLIQTADLSALENQQKAQQLRNSIKTNMSEDEQQRILRNADILEQRAEAETKLAHLNAIRTNLVGKEIADQEKLASIYVDQYEAKRKIAETEVEAMSKHERRQAYADYHGYTYDKSTKKIKDIEGNEIDYDDAAIKDEVIEQTVMLDFEANASSLEGILHSLDRDFSKTLDKTFENSSTFISDVLSNNAEANEDLLQQVLDNPEQLNDFVEGLSTKEIAAVLGVSEETVESNVNGYKQQLEDKLLTNAQNIIDTNAQASGELAAMLAQAQGKNANEVLISKNIQNGLIEQVKNFTSEQRNTLLNIGKILEESAGSEAMATFVGGLSNIYRTGSEELKAAAQDWIDSVNWETATGRLKGYNEAINMTVDNTEHLGEESVKQLNNLGQSLLNSRDEANLLGEAFEEFYNSTDFQEMAENMDKFVDSSGQLNAASIMDMAEECHSLNNLLDTGAISAGGIAAALNALGSSGDLVLSDLNSRVLELLSNFGQLDDIIASSHRNIENFDWGIDTGEAEDFVKESAKKWNELYKNGEVGNPQLEAYAKWVMGEDKYITLLASKNGDLQKTMAEVSKYVNKYSEGFTEAWDDLASGNWEIDKKDLSDNLKDLGISASFNDDGSWHWEPGKATTAELQQWLQEVKGIGPELAQAMIEDWSNYSPNFRAERQKNDFEAGLDSYVKQRRGANGEVAITASELNAIIGATGQEKEDIIAAIAEKADIDAEQIKILENIDKNTGEYVTDGAILNKELTQAIGAKGQNGWLAAYQAKDSSGKLMKNTIDIGNAMAGAIERGYTAAQAKSMAYESYTNAKQQGKDYYYKGQLIEAGQYKTLDQFAARLEEIDQNEQWVTVGQAMADGFLNRINELEKPEDPSDKIETKKPTTSDIPKGTTVPGVGYVAPDGKVVGKSSQYDNAYAEGLAKNKEAGKAIVDAFTNLWKNRNPDVEDPKVQALQKSAEETGGVLDRLNSFLNTSYNEKTGYTTETTSTSTDQANENLTAGSESLTEAASQLIGGIESLSAAGESLNTAASNLTTAAAVITNNSGNNNNSTNGSSTVPGVPQTAQPNQSSVGGAIVIDNSAALSSLDEVYQKATETATKINEGATFTIETPGLKDLTKAASAAQKVTDNAGSKNISLNTSISGASSENIDTLKESVKKFNALGSHKVTLTTNLKGASASSIETIIAAINSFHLKTDHTVTLKTIKETITKDNATGSHNHGYASPPSFGSAARGSYGQVGPKGKGGLTLTGELGYEIAWLPSENRSMILGANGPQMVNLPGDAVVWTHEQSKQILKQKAIPAGSHSDRPRPGGGGGGSSATSSVYQRAKNKSSTTSDAAAKEVIKITQKAGKVLVWWENAGHRMDKAQRNAEGIQRELKNLLKIFGTTAEQYKTAGQEYEKYLNQQIKIASEKEAKANQELEYTNKGRSAVNTTTANKAREELNKAQAAYNKKKSKANKKKLDAAQKAYDKAADKELEAVGARTEISYEVTKKKKNKKGKWTKTKKTKTENINLANYITKDSETGAYIIDQTKINDIAKTNGSKAKAIAEAAEKQLNELLSKQKQAEDEKIKAEEALAEFYDTTYETFYSWEKTINEAYLLSQQLEKLSNLRNVFEATEDLEFAKLEAGFSDISKSLPKVSRALEQNRELLLAQVQANSQLIDAKYKEYQAVLSNETELLNYVANKDSQKAAYDLDAKNATLDFLKSIGQEGTLNYQAAVNELNARMLSTESYNKIKDVLDKIAEKQTEYYDALTQTYQTMTEVYQTIEEYQSYMADFESNLIKGIEEQANKEIDKLNKLNSTLDTAAKDLIDEVKRKLDERRKQEDNAKTEQDINKKQQRLAALQADTSGGHQVEIAQLQKEIAEAQQSYERTLEDQLLDKLSQQQDEASKQRERQISLLESQRDIAIALGTNVEKVNEWLQNPAQNYDAIRAAWLENQGYSDAGALERKQLEEQFEVAWTHFLAYGEALPKLAEIVESKALSEATEEPTLSTVEQISGQLDEVIDLLSAGTDGGQIITTYSVENLKEKGYTDVSQIRGILESNGQTASAREFESNGFSLADISKAYTTQELKAENYTIDDLKNYKTTAELGSAYSAAEFGAAKISYDEAKKVFSLNELSKVIEYAQQATADIDKQNKYNAYINYLKEVKQLKPKNVKSSHINQLFTLGSAAGYGKASVLSHLVGSTGGSDPFSWKNIFKAIIDAKGIDRYNLVKTWPNGSGTLADAIKTLSKNPNTYAEIKKTTKYKNAKALAFKTGGLANYTGPAWLDGTPSKPELVLNAKDTQNFLALRNILSKAIGSTSSINNSYGGDNIYEININVDKIEKDYDVDKVAERVKKIIVKDSGYRNVTQVRNFR